MGKKTYKWLTRLVDKITKKDCPNNNYFWYYGREVTLSSGTRDYVDVTIAEVYGGGWHKNEICFTFDFWTRDLCFNSYNNYEERDAIIKAFRKYYDDRWDSVTVKYDEPWEEEKKEIEPYLDNDDYEQESIRQKYDALMEREAA